MVFSEPVFSVVSCTKPVGSRNSELLPGSRWTRLQKNGLLRVDALVDDQVRADAGDELVDLDVEVVDR